MITLTREAGVLGFAGAILLCVGCSADGLGCQATTWTAPMKQTLALDTDGLIALDVKTHNGGITFHALESRDAGARVVATKKAGGSSPADAESAMEALEVFIELAGGGTQRVGWRWKVPKERSWQAQVAFEIHAPQSLNLSATTHNGDVDVKRVSGDVRLETHNGGIDVSAEGGKLHAETHNGRIEADYAGADLTLTSHNGRIEANLAGCTRLEGGITTRNGRVEVVVGLALSAGLQGRTHNGAIRCDAPLTNMQTSRGKLTGTFGTGEGTLTVTTYNGGITVTEASE